jgi:hypothetical protein
VSGTIRTLAAVVGIGGLLGILQAAGTLLWYYREGIIPQLIESGNAASVFGQMALGVFFSACAIALAVLILRAPNDEGRSG